MSEAEEIRKLALTLFESGFEEDRIKGAKLLLALDTTHYLGEIAETLRAIRLDGITTHPSS